MQSCLTHIPILTYICIVNAICQNSDVQINTLPQNIKNKKTHKSREVEPWKVSILRSWLNEHSHQPYPSKKEKVDFTHSLHLTPRQVENWFINNRRVSIVFNSYLVFNTAYLLLGVSTNRLCLLHMDIQT